ncbi:MAG: hypothetical protein WAL24_00780 [Nitrososphaeraceae archaeon]
MNATFIRNRVTAMALIVGIVLMLISTTFPLNPIHAETGKGDDIFRVIMTIFGIDKSKGDVIAIVTANNGEASKVKFLDSEAPYVIPLNSSRGTSGHLIEYVATFPNVTVNAGDVYKACVLTTKDLNMVCNTGQNSPASRPEFVDISLNATSTTLSDETISEESDEVDEGNGD